MWANRLLGKVLVGTVVTRTSIWPRVRAQSVRGASAVQIAVIAIQIANILHSNGTGTSLRGLNRCTSKRPTLSPEHWMKRWPCWPRGKLGFCREARIFIPRSAIAWCTDRWWTFRGWEDYGAYRAKRAGSALAV